MALHAASSLSLRSTNCLAKILKVVAYNLGLLVVLRAAGIPK